MKASQLVIIGASSRLASNWSLFPGQEPLLVHTRPGKKTRIDGEPRIDIRGDLRDLREILDRCQASTLINAVAITDVEACNTHPALAHAVNADFPIRLAQLTKALEIKLIHISTDHLTSGTRALVGEDIECTPLNVYAASKLRGERGVGDVDSRSLIVRTNFFGQRSAARDSFSSWILGRLKQGHPVELFNDVFFTPIFSLTLIQILCELMTSDAAGLLNVVSSERLSKYDFGKRLARVFDLDALLVREAHMAERTDLIVRPMDMSLSNSRLIGLLKREPPDLEEQLLAYVSLESRNVFRPSEEV